MRTLNQCILYCSVFVLSIVCMCRFDGGKKNMRQVVEVHVMTLNILYNKWFQWWRWMIMNATGVTVSYQAIIMTAKAKQAIHPSLLLIQSINNKEWIAVIEEIIILYSLSPSSSTWNSSSPSWISSTSAMSVECLKFDFELSFWCLLFSATGLNPSYKYNFSSSQTCVNDYTRSRYTMICLPITINLCIISTPVIVNTSLVEQSSLSQIHQPIWGKQLISGSRCFEDESLLSLCCPYHHITLAAGCDLWWNIWEKCQCYWQVLLTNMISSK